MSVPAAIAALPMIGGAIAGLLAADHATSDLALRAAAAALLALIGAVSAVALGSRADAIVAIGAGCALAGLSLAVTSAQRAYHPPLLRWFESRSPPDAMAPVSIEGVLREDAVLSAAGPSLIVDVEQVAGTAPPGQSAAWRLDRPGGVRLSIGGSLAGAVIQEWRAGRRVRVTALLRLPSWYTDPGVRDDRRVLARRGIVLVGAAKSAVMVDVVRRGSWIAESAATTRWWVRRELAQAVGRWSPRSAAVATAVLIGDRTGLSDADTRRLQDAGTYHVIAISGGNIAILTMMLMVVLTGLGAPARPAAVITIIGLLAYREIVVSAPSVERAISAAVLYLAARVLDQRGSALNLLAVAATLGVASAPVVLLDPGFILSFGATLGILVFALADSRTSPGHVRSLVQRAVAAVFVLWWTTVAAEAALLPVAAMFFGRVTVAGLILNFAAIPLMGLLQAASIAALAVSPCSAAAAAACGYVAHLAAVGIVESARLTELLPGLARDVAPPLWWITAMYYGSALAALHGAGGRSLRRGAVAVTCVMACMIISGPGWAVDAVPPPASGVRVVFLDVGQGDATALIFPGGRAVLVDAGGVANATTPDPAASDTGAFDIGQRVVAPALRALGVRRLDALAITHGDPDHIGGAAAILRAFRPPSIWEGVPVPPHPWLRAVTNQADALGLHWRTVQAGDAERIGPVLIRVLHPPLPDWERQRVRNEDSVVLDVRIGDVSIVLPGDIGQEGERAIRPLLQPAAIVVFKAPHHGSATSSTPALLAALRPAVVVFSAGRDNRFGHPAAAVVARYRELGVAMWSTAQDGAIVLDTDGKTVTLNGWTGRSQSLLARGP